MGKPVGFAVWVPWVWVWCQICQPMPTLYLSQVTHRFQPPTRTLAHMSGVYLLHHLSHSSMVSQSPTPLPLPSLTLSHPMLSHLHCLKPVLKDMTPPLPSQAPPPTPASLALTLKDATPRVAHGYGYKPALLTCGF